MPAATAVFTVKTTGSPPPVPVLAPRGEPERPGKVELSISHGATVATSRRKGTLRPVFVLMFTVLIPVPVTAEVPLL
jgi:hypothetical protein